MDISNKTLAIFLAVAVVVSIGGTMISLQRLNILNQPRAVTGYATDVTGVANVTIQSTFS